MENNRAIRKHAISRKINIVNTSVDAIDIIREKSFFPNENNASLYICNVSDVISKHNAWKQHMPRVQPFYAVKCNDDPIVIQTLASLGAGFDCASKGEIAQVMGLGVRPESIIFANPTKPVVDLKFASKMNVKLMTVDGNFELQKIAEFYPTAKLVLRVRFDAKASKIPLGAKHGCDPRTEAPGLIKLSKTLGLDMVGICFHVGSGCLDPPVFSRAIAAARKLFDIAESVGYSFNLLDVGGGFPGEKDTNIAEFASIVNQSIDLHFPTPDVTIIAEPGRYYVASAYTLSCRVHSKREVLKNGKFHSMMYFINDGVYGSFQIVLYQKALNQNHKVTQPLTLKSCNQELFNSSIWGPTMDAADEVCKNILLPRLDINDVIIFEDMGAYTVNLATRFNGILLPEIEYFIERQHWKELKSSMSSQNFITEKILVNRPTLHSVNQFVDFAFILSSKLISSLLTLFK